MTVYRYTKRPPTSSQNNIPLALKSGNKSTKKRIAAVFMVLVGVFLLGNAIFPIAYYQFAQSPRFTTSASDFEESEPENISPNTAVLGSQIKLVDYTKASNWISGIDEVEFISDETSYEISIPNLGINSAIVNVGGNDLTKSLIQYPGTSLPGRPGNPVVFGHSVLPQFFNPKNYKSIFSTLPRLKEGDDIIVRSGGVTYKYLVERMVEKGPDDLSILAQRYDDSYLTLVTCVPPGTYLKRLVVRARITKI